MGKLFFQFLIITGTFLGLWFILSRINFKGNDLIEKLYSENEKKLGNLIIDELTDENTEIKSPGLNAIIDSMLEELVWFSTHPDARERAALIRVKKKEMHVRTIPLITTSWEKVQELVKIN